LVSGTGAYDAVIGSDISRKLHFVTNGVSQGYFEHYGALNLNKSLLTDSIKAKSSSGIAVYNNSGTKVAEFGASGGVNTTLSGSVTANSFVKSGGTSSQFLKADGSVDGKTYLTSASIAGKLNISDTASMLSNYRRTTTKITNSDLVNSTISGIALGSNLSNLSAGSGLVGTAYNGSSAQTFRVDTGRVATQIVTGGSLNKVRDSVVSLINSSAIGSDYTPTLSNVSNVSGTPTLSLATYIKVGDIVSVTVSGSLTPTSSNTNTILGITLPFTTSATTPFFSGSGIYHGNSSPDFSAGGIVSITGTNAAQFRFYPTINTSGNFSFTFQYKVN